MAYLTKNQRHEEISKLAMQIALDEGLSAITARHIAAKGSFAIGQIHHHFQSISQLKALALHKVSDDLMTQAEQNYINISIPEQLINIISPIEGEMGSMMRKLWSEAVFLAERDNEIKKAYKQSIEEWHQAIVKLINQGKKQNIFNTPIPTETAWELIALSCGFDNIAVIEEFRFEKHIIKNCIYRILQINPPLI
ncbi:TetR family transcriptional regulator [Entomomonas moraniae]|uniref:TetR family transcriptional regulator n=1 Tax=Entomomonas moraniae TaxID=2213226 RepID=A0A3S9XFX7_9GAMM|nr:TetR family transcriptional regulator [Entomomonas moraniae]AZS51238.1 TetR family transcriptional regulator [Entomomonas moraniae]